MTIIQEIPHQIHVLDWVSYCMASFFQAVYVSLDRQLDRDNAVDDAHLGENLRNRTVD